MSHANQRQQDYKICETSTKYDIPNPIYNTSFIYSFERKANKMFLKATQTLEHSTGFSLKKNTSYSDNLSAEDYANDGDQELDKYLVLMLGLQRLLIWERQLLTDIIPTSRHSEVFSRLAQQSIEMVVKDAEVSSVMNFIIVFLTDYAFSVTYVYPAFI